MDRSAGDEGIMTGLFDRLYNAMAYPDGVPPQPPVPAAPAKKKRAHAPGVTVIGIKMTTRDRINKIRRKKDLPYATSLESQDVTINRLIDFYESNQRED